jgi:hypothetical protein
LISQSIQRTKPAELSFLGADPQGQRISLKHLEEFITMKRPALLIGVSLWLTFSCCGQHLVQAKSPSKAGPAPETSLNESFHPHELAKVAVIAFTEVRKRQVQSDQQRLVEDLFVQALLQRGHVVVARSDIKSVLTEQSLATSGLTDSNAAAVGKLLNVPAVLVVRITEYATENQREKRKNSNVRLGQVTVGAQLVSVETGEIWWQGNHTASEVISGNGELPVVLAKVTGRLAMAFPAKIAKANPYDPKDIHKLALVMVGETRRRNINLGVGSDYQGSGEDKLKRFVEDKLGVALGNKGYVLVSRSDLQAVMEEKRFQQSGLTEENVSDFGKLLNVPAVMVVRITECGADSVQNVTVATAALGARLVSVETGEILWCRTWIESQKVRGKLDTTQLLAKVAKKIGDAFPSKHSAKRVAAPASDEPR